MATPDLTAGQVMDISAALLNDVAKTVYTYVAQIPYLNLALQELQETFEQNEVPVTDTQSAAIEVDADVSAIGFTTTPPLPSNLIEPTQLWERPRGIDPYVPMTRVDKLPLYMAGVQVPQLIYYVWASQELRFMSANADNDIKIQYTRNLFTEVTASTDEIGIINAATFLENRTAALCAFFIGENKTRSDDLNIFASLAMDRVVGIGTKGRQSIVTRRRPFRSGFKRRTYL